MDRYAQDQGIALDAAAMPQLITNRAIIDQAINLDILRHYAETNNITVTMEEVNAFFQSVTTADQRRMLVEQWRSQGRSPSDVLEEERQTRVLQKAADSIGATARVTYYEAWQDYLKQNERLVADYYKVSPSDFISSVTVTEEGLKAYFDENIETFRVPEQVQYDFVLVRKDDLKSSLTVTEDEITSYYNNNREDFRLPRKVEATQVFLQLPSPEELNTTSPEELARITQAVMARADDLYERAAKGENFENLAQTSTEEVNYPSRADEDTTATDTASTTPGYLGILSEEVAETWYGEQWTSAVFSMQPGGITRPIRTSNAGVAIVQVKNIISGEIQPLEEVRTIVENAIRTEKVEPVFEQAGEELQRAVDRVTSLDQVAVETSATVATSPKVNRDANFLPGIGLLGDFQEPVTDLQEGGRSDVLSDSQRHLVIQIREEFPAHNPELETIRGRVEQAYKQKLAEEAARAKAEELLKISTDFTAFETALADADSTYTTSRPFTRSEAVSIFGGMLSNFSDETAGMKQGDITMTTVGRPGQQQSFVVWHLAELTEPSKTDFAKELGSLTQRLEERKQEIMVLEYMRDQREQLKNSIKIDENFI